MNMFILLQRLYVVSLSGAVFQWIFFVPKKARIELLNCKLLHIYKDKFWVNILVGHWNEFGLFVNTSTYTDTIHEQKNMCRYCRYKGPTTHL